MKIEKKSVLLRLEENEMVEIKTMSKVMGITPSLFYRLAIRSSLKFYKNKYRLIDKPMDKPIKQLDNDFDEEIQGLLESMKHLK